MHIQIPLIIRGDGGTYRLCEQRHELVVIHQRRLGCGSLACELGMRRLHVWVCMQGAQTSNDLSVETHTPPGVLSPDLLAIS